MDLALEDITARYGHVTALRSTSLSAEAGKITCIVGPNGAGKSTLTAVASGALKPAGGQVRINNNDCKGLGPEQISGMGVSLVPEGRHVFASMTVEENLRVAASAVTKERLGWLSGPRASAQKIDKVLERFPRLRERYNAYAGTLSGGEQQQLVVARALMTEPKLLLIDEPSLGLAPKIIDLVYELLISLKERDGLTLLIVEQSTHRALQVADRLYVLRNGAICYDKKAPGAQDEHDVQTAYFGFDPNSTPEARGMT